MRLLRASHSESLHAITACGHYMRSPLYAVTTCNNCMRLLREVIACRHCLPATACGHYMRPLHAVTACDYCSEVTACGHCMWLHYMWPQVCMQSVYAITSCMCSLYSVTACMPSIYATTASTMHSFRIIVLETL